jgi:hypothetical protein
VPAAVLQGWHEAVAEPTGASRYEERAAAAQGVPRSR